MTLMRTHSDIIRDAGGARAVHDLLGLIDKIHTVRSWVQRDSIPPEYWSRLAALGVATTDELAAAVAREAEKAATP